MWNGLFCDTRWGLIEFFRGTDDIIERECPGYFGGRPYPTFDEYFHGPEDILPSSSDSSFPSSVVYDQRRPATSDAIQSRRRSGQRQKRARDSLEA
jgi:hypothetical protein